MPLSYPFKILIRFRARVWCLRMGIGPILLSEKRPITFLSEKLNEAWQKWSIYEQELYAVYRSLKTWESYRIACDIVLFSESITLTLQGPKAHQQDACNVSILLWAIQFYDPS